MARTTTTTMTMRGVTLLVTLVVHFSLIALAVALPDLSASSWGFSVKLNFTNQAQALLPSMWSIGSHTNGLEPLLSPLPSPERNSTEQFGRKKGGLRKIVNNVVRKIRAANLREFIYEHNKVRQQLDEPALVWDKKLARFAERFANQRKKECDMVHSGGEYGENIYWGQHYERHSAAEAVRAWASEGDYYHLNDRSCSAPDKMCGHYTQIIWKTSKRIGCARVKCDNGGVYIICVYDPPGNWRNEDPLTSTA